MQSENLFVYVKKKNLMIGIRIHDFLKFLNYLKKHRNVSECSIGYLLINNKRKSMLKKIK